MEHDGDHFEQLAAGKTLLEVEADNLPSQEVLRGTARGFLALANMPIPDAKEMGVQGMVRFGGKHSVHLALRATWITSIFFTLPQKLGDARL